MATLATIYNRFVTARDTAEAQFQTADGTVGVPLPALANEDVYWFVKRIDNSRVVRAADPRAGGACWRMIVSMGVTVLMLIGVLLPSAYGLFAGYQLQALKGEAARLKNEQTALDLEESRLLSPARMEELARKQKFADPTAESVIYLEPKGVEARTR
jgi:cell division protein FtsL